MKENLTQMDKAFSINIVMETNDKTNNGAERDAEMHNKL